MRNEGEESPSRRGMLGLGRFAAAAGVSLAAIAASRAAEAATVTDVDIFNFALNFEYIGAEYYLHAVLGHGLAAYNSSLVTGSVGTQGSVTTGVSGSTVVPFTDKAVAYFAIQLANDELAHVEFIRTVLGSSAIAEPSINFAAFTPVAQAAGLISSTQTFNPFASEINFLLGAYLLEDTCVTALTGAANLLTSKTNLSYAAGLLGVESQQAGAIRGFLSQFGQDTATDAISALRAKLSTVGDQGTGNEGNPFNISNGDSQAQAYRRTPAQILAIAYSGAGLSSGAFFPSGVNGSNSALTTS